MDTITHLNRYFHFTRLMTNPGVECGLSTYVSQYDGSIQSLFVMKPEGKVSNKVVFFFHGMDGDCGDAVIAQDVSRNLNVTVIAAGGRGPSWVSDAFLADTEQVLSEHSSNFDGYYLMGISMGGAQVLSLPGLMSEEALAKLQGVIALMPGADLEAIAKSSAHERVRRTLSESVAKDPILLSERSPINLVGRYRGNYPFAIFRKDSDSILLTDRLDEYIHALKTKHSTSVITAEGDHEFVYENFNYKDVFDSLGKDVSVRLK